MLTIAFDFHSSYLTILLVFVISSRTDTMEIDDPPAEPELDLSAERFVELLAITLPFPHVILIFGIISVFIQML